MAIRDTQTNAVTMIKNENFSHNITAIASHYSGDLSRVAMAEQDFYDPSQLYFSIYEVKEGNICKMLSPRIRIDLPEDEVSSPGRLGEESKSRAPLSRLNQEFSSAAASSPGHRDGNSALHLPSVAA